MRTPVEDIPDGVVVELKEVGDFVEQDSSRLRYNHLLDPHLRGETNPEHAHQNQRG